MITASIDLSALDRQLSNLAAILGPQIIAPALDADVAAFYEALPVPVHTGRLDRAASHANRHTPRGRDSGGRFTPGGISQTKDRYVVVEGDTVRVEIRVPYARYQLRRLAPYSPVDLLPRINAQINAALASGGGTGSAP